MAVSNEAILNYLQTPGLTDTQIAQAMKDNGVTPQQVAAATNMKEADVTKRYDTANAISSWQSTAKPTADTAWAAQMKTAGWTPEDVSRNTGVDVGNVTNRYQSANAVNELTGKLDTTNKSLADMQAANAKAQEQLAALQKSYDAISSSKTGGIMTPPAGGGVLSGAGTDTAVPVINTPTPVGGSGIVTGALDVTTTGAEVPTAPGNATTGVVYGPDGTMYSSAAAAIAAGIRNYSTTKPAGLLASADKLGGQFNTGSSFMSGSNNPGGLISGAKQQLFKNTVSAQMPYGVKNPFSKGV